MRSTTAPASPDRRVVRSSPGRLRVHLTEPVAGALSGLRGRPGVRAVNYRPSTGNLLIEYDPSVTSEDELLDVLAGRAARAGRADDAESLEAAAASAARSERVDRWMRRVVSEHAGRVTRVRIAVPGIDRDPRLARRVVERLERRPDVKRAAASATTGRVLVEFSEHVVSIQDLIAEISRIDLPEIPADDQPSHPLDPAPILQSGARAIGAAAGIGWLAVRRALGPRDGGPVSSAPAVLAGTIGLLDSIPPVREQLRRGLGPNRAQILLGGASIVSLTLSSSPLGLLVSGAGALRVFVEARQRRDAWREYEERLEGVPGAQPGAVVKLESGTRVPLPARVIEGRGTIAGNDGLPDTAQPGGEIPAGARVLRGPLVVELLVGDGFAIEPRPAEPRRDALERYITALGPVSLGYAVLHAVRRRSPLAAFTGLLLVNPRAAVVGSDFATTGASSRVLRAGVTVVGTRSDRPVRRPDAMIIDSPRVLVEGLERIRFVPIGERDRSELTELVAGLRSVGDSAEVAGRRVRLVLPPASAADAPEVRRATEAGEQAAVLRDEDSGEDLAYVHMRPRLAPGVNELRTCAERHGVALTVLEGDDRRASRAVAERAGIPLVLEADLTDLVRDRQRTGDRVAVVSDSAEAAAAFEACDLAIALTSGRSSRFQARADLLAPGLHAVAAIVDAGARRDQAVRASVVCSIAANAAGAALGLRSEVDVVHASYATYIGAIAAMGPAWERLHGGGRSRSVVSRLTDPRPERWGRVDHDGVLAELNSRGEGLTSEEAEGRREARGGEHRRNAFIAAMSEQLESPIVVVLGAGAAVSLAFGSAADVAIIGAVVLANAAVGAWQERQAGRAAHELARIGAASARVLRDGEVKEIPAEEVVPGDILLLHSGDRVVADGRLIEAEALEVDESSLTGESLPVAKFAGAGGPVDRIVLEGSDVIVGTGKAVVVAVGRRTRLGATAAALSVEETRTSQLGQRLDVLFRQGLPIVIGGGLLVTAAGIAWGGEPLAQLAVGASVAIAAVPEGLPLLAGVAGASVARRLARRQAYVRRLASVEALGRVDVVCSDKTGTLTQGRLALTTIDTLHELHELPGLDELRQLARGEPGSAARSVLLCAALASPAPDAPEASSHPTDGAILRAAIDGGLADELGAERRAEAPFDPARGFHATLTTERICVKGAAEIVAARCTETAVADGSPVPLGDGARAELLARAEALAERGLRVLMVADGPPGVDVNDPRGLCARGFIGISDPIRPGAADALRRCREAGIRVIMLTGDHPATARAIARQLGLDADDGAVLTGEEIEHVHEGNLSEQLERASVVARITPIDKLRIVESLRASGHTVAMTGDGVNDAPALRLADVGVAMGVGGTEVARQAADLVLGDDRFETLTEALLEGRSLWQNLQSSLGLLLGGNLGEVTVMVGAAMLGRGALLSARQILAINLVTDVLPAVAVAAQSPREDDLRSVSLDPDEAFERRLRAVIARRGAATAVPSLVAVMVAPLLGAQSGAVAFGSIVATQLAQTLESGAREHAISRPVAGAVAGSTVVLGGSLIVPPVRRFLGLPALSLPALGLIAGSAPAAVILARALPGAGAGRGPRELERHTGWRGPSGDPSRV